MSSASLSILLGTATTELFALGTDGKMKRSEDNGVTWQDETLDEDVSLLPVSQIAMTHWNYSPIDSTDYVLMAGTNQQGDVCLWRKVSQYGGDSKGGQWRVCVVAHYLSCAYAESWRGNHLCLNHPC